MKRIWNLRLNLDELNALNLTGIDEKTRSDLWTGLVYGCNGIDLPEGSSKGHQTGFEVGSGWRNEAESHQERMSLGGKASAESRKKKVGTAQPSKVARSTIEAPSEGGSNQSTIYNLQSTNLVPSTPLPPGKKSSPSRARQSAKKKESLPPPEHLLPKLGTIVKDWPRRSDYKGVITPISLLGRPADLWSRIEKFVPEADRELAVDCGLVYLDDLDTRERGVAGLIPNVCAMTNFYGEAELWKKMIVRVDEKRAERGPS